MQYATGGLFLALGFALVAFAPALAGDFGTRLLKSTTFHRGVGASALVLGVIQVASGGWGGILTLLVGIGLIGWPERSARAQAVLLDRRTGHQAVYLIGGVFFGLFGFLVLIEVIHVQ